MEAYLASDRGKKKRLASIIIKEGDKTTKEEELDIAHSTFLSRKIGNSLF